MCLQLFVYISVYMLMCKGVFYSLVSMQVPAQTSLLSLKLNEPFIVLAMNMIKCEMKQ